MSALLSPPKPIRTRFKVPGEGCYQLLSSFPPPPPPPPPTYSSTPSTTPKPPPAPTPLGLPTVTRLSLSTETALSRPETSLFSLRKLTQLAKFSADDDVAVPPRIANPATGVMSYNIPDGILLSDMSGAGGGTVTPRAPPTAHALGGGGRLLVGCQTGDVYIYDTAKRVVMWNCIAVPSRIVSALWHANSVVTVHDRCVVVYDTRYKHEEKYVARALAENEVSVETRRKSGFIWHLGVGILTNAAFSHDGKLLALSSRDGFTRVIDWKAETIRWAFRSYFGAVLCVAFSRDDKWLAAGGEDDLVTIYDPHRGAAVARLEGHTSWVSAVAWDDAHHAPQYRLASAGQDTKLLLWDFCLQSLGGNRTTTGHVHGVVVEPDVKGVPVVEPVVAHEAHAEPLTDVVFGKVGVVTADGGGAVKVWARPPAMAVPKISLGKSGRATDLD